MTLRLRTSPGSAYAHLYWRTPNSSGDVPEEVNEVTKGANKMGKVSTHLKAFHEHSATHHDTLAKCYSKLAGFGKSATSEGLEVLHQSEMRGDDGEGLNACLQKIADTHANAAAYHKAALAECSKAIEASDLEKNQLVPTQVSRVAPDVPQGVRAVTRVGAKPFPAQHAAVPVGGIDFSKIIGVRDEDLNEL
jgi:hypothetical protein